MKINKYLIWLMLVITILSQFNLPVFAVNETVVLSPLSQKGDSVISLNVRNADIRDVLSALAVNMGSNIVYTEEPVKVDFSVQSVTCEEALDYLLKSVGMEYIKDNNTIIAGTRESLEKNYLDKIALTKFNLKYIRADVLSSQIDALSIPVKKVTLDTNDKVIWVQGLPGDLSKVAQLVAMLDKAENAYWSEEYKLSPVTLTHISADLLNNVLNDMGFYGGLIIDSNPMTLWIYGTEEDAALANEIKTQLDIPQNTLSNNFVLKRKDLQYLTSEKAKDVIQELNIDINVVALSRRMQTVWLSGTQEAVNLALSVLNQVDIKDNLEQDHMAVYNLRNITAKEAMARLRSIENEKNVKFYTFSFPQFVKSVMVFCPQDYRLHVLAQLEEIDVASEEIKVPVDYSNHSSGTTKLKNRRDLICEITGLPEDKFTISKNVARDDNHYYIMYLEASPDVVQYVKDVIKMIDNPLTDGANE